MPETPTWALELVAAIEEHEDVHGQPSEGAVCFGGLLPRVPAEVRAEARGYARAKREVSTDDAR